MKKKNGLQKKFKIAVWTDVFVFGSAIRSKKPNDLDLLFVYEPKLCPPEKAREQAEAWAFKLKRKLNLHPHCVVLTKAEERGISFIQNERCVTFHNWLKAKRVLRAIDQTDRNPKCEFLT